MMKWWLIILAIYAGADFCHAKEDYAYDRIPKELLKNANAVVRNYHTEVIISGGDDVTINERYAVTVLNEKGAKHSLFKAGYDKLKSVESVHGWLYDETGKEIGRMKKADLGDLSSGDANVYDEHRYKIHAFDHSTYPFTVEYEVSTHLSSAFFLPQWSPYEGYDCSVESEDISVVYPKTFELRYRTYNLKEAVVVADDEDNKKLALAVSGLPAPGKREDFSRDEASEAPRLVYVANKFQLEGMEASMATWSDFGRFFYNLNVNRDTLPEATKKMVHALTDTCKTTFSKIKILYAYLQKNTRYVNIVLGIGGLQEWNAAYVATKGYGDCKALSNFMKSLLKEAGIPAYQLLVYGGPHPPRLDPAFPYSAFNHAILCVPQEKDTVWLECISGDYPAGYMGSFTGNRLALLTSSSGGCVVRTPSYGDHENNLSRTVNMSVTAGNELTGTVDCGYKGLWWEREHPLVAEGGSKLSDHFNSEFTIPTYKVDDYTTSQGMEGYLPLLSEHIRLHGSGRLTRNGAQLIVSPHVLKFTIPAPSSYEPRKDSFVISSGYSVSDTILIALDGTYEAQKNLKKIDHDFPFASYHTQTLCDGKVLKVCISYVQHKGIYPPSIFEDYIALSKEINTGAAFEKVVLVKKD